MEKEKRFFLDPPSIGCSLCTSRLHWQHKTQSCGSINIGRCDSHTYNNHLATSTLPGERIISAFHVKCAQMKVLKISSTKKMLCGFAATIFRLCMHGVEKSIRGYMGWKRYGCCFLLAYVWRKGNLSLVVKTRRSVFLHDEREEKEISKHLSPASTTRDIWKSISVHVIKYGINKCVDLLLDTKQVAHIIGLFSQRKKHYIVNAQQALQFLLLNTLFTPAFRQGNCSSGEG